MWSTGEPKATRSPGLAWARLSTLVPILAWSAATRGSLMPRSPYARWTSPEQSRPLLGSFEPYTYLMPRYFLALSITALPEVPEVPETLESRPVDWAELSALAKPV